MLKSPTSIYPFTIKSFNADYKGLLSMSSLFLFLQECAWENAMENGFGYEFVESENALWVLTRVLVKMDHLPKWKEDISIKTWPRHHDGLLAIRDYQIMKDDLVLGGVSSSWLILDKISKRPRKLADFPFSSYDFIQEKAIVSLPQKIMLPEGLKMLDQRKVYASDMDVNGHVNNATYVRWIFDAYFSGYQEQFKEFEINFLGELKLNDEFLIYEGNKNAQYFYLIKTLENNIVCTARIGF